MADFPTLEEMTAEDYAALGLMAGLEVHQQLCTDRKLFCRCPAHRFTTGHDAEVLRHMRPTLSELGEYDGTALMEFKTKKQIIYRINRDSICTYETDDAPPFELNDQALEYAMEICLMFGCSIVGEVHIARKQYLDGSIPTGFQRTAIIGLDGEIPFGADRVVRVQQISLEEDSCREVSDDGHWRIYDTDRLSIPLIEVVTKPDMKTPHEVARVATEVRKLTRASHRAATGMGSGRQDVNVSVRGGTRIEIKGVPRIPLIPRLVHYEALRQRALLDIMESLGPRDAFKVHNTDVTELAPELGYEPIDLTLATGGRLVAVCVKGFAEALNTPTAPGRTFASEVADRVRVVACLDRLPNIAHHPCPGSPIDPDAWAKVRLAAGAADDEAVVLVWGGVVDLKTAVGEIADRCREAFDGVPSETRQVRADGTTGFERILPGPDRMYPDTDLPPTPVPQARVEAATERIPPPSWIQEARLVQAGAPPHLAAEVVMDGLWDLAAPPLDHGLGGQRVVEVLVEKSRALTRAGELKHGIQDLDPADVAALFTALHRGALAREALLQVMRGLARGQALEALLQRFAVPDDDALEAGIAAALDETPPRAADPAAARRYWLGRASSRLQHRVPGATLNARLAAALEAK